jgi:hypothetical protein
VSIHVLNGSVPLNIAEPMRLIDETDELEGMVCATLGYGWNGLGSSGHGFNADGFRWGGENIIDVYGSPASSGGTQHHLDRLRQRHQRREHDPEQQLATRSSSRRRPRPETAAVRSWFSSGTSG